MRMKIMEEIFVTSLEKDGKCMREYEESESDKDDEESQWYFEKWKWKLYI